jgi:hypothetical protein
MQMHYVDIAQLRRARSQRLDQLLWGTGDTVDENSLT